MDAYTGQDTIVVEDYDGKFTLEDYADGVCVEITAPNESSTTNTGFNGNSLGAHNEPGRQRQAVIRLVKGSGNDKRFNTSWTFWQNRDIRFKPLKLTCTKRVSHSDGSVTNDTQECFFGLPVNPPVPMVDTTGNTDQVVSVYTFRFGNSKRTL